MEMKELVDMITNTGATIAVLGYFIYRDYKFMSTLQTTLQALVDTVDRLKDIVRKE